MHHAPQSCISGKTSVDELSPSSSLHCSPEKHSVIFVCRRTSFYSPFVLAPCPLCYCRQSVSSLPFDLLSLLPFIDPSLFIGHLGSLRQFRFYFYIKCTSIISYNYYIIIYYILNYYNMNIIDVIICKI